MIEVRISGGSKTAGTEVFRGDTEAEVLNKLSRAKKHANRRIAIQAKQIELLLNVIELLAEKLDSRPPAKMREMVESILDERD